MTILNYAGGHHAFEGIDDEDATRDVIDSTIDFVKRATVPSYQASLRRGIPEATAAAAVAAGDFVTASAAYAELVKAKRTIRECGWHMELCSGRRSSLRHVPSSSS